MTGFRALAAFVAVALAGLTGGALHAQTPGPLDGAQFGAGNGALVVVLHGDVSRGGAANYHYALARDIAAAAKGTVAVALLRPGYFDGQGRRSPGSDNNRRDHYTAANNDLVARTISALKTAHRPARIVAIGHSGGAAQIGAIIGRNPGLIDTAILVSCPCDIPRWRQMKGASAWPASQSPQDFIPRIARATRIIAMTGTNDTNTRSVLAQDYVAAARARGINASYIGVNGAGHDLGTSFARQVKSAALQALR